MTEQQLQQAQAKVERADAAAAKAREQRDEVVRIAHNVGGLSAYRIAQVVGLSQPAVSKILDAGISDAARRIAAESKTVAPSDKIVFDAEGNVLGRPYRSDRVLYEYAAIVDRRVTPREAQRILDDTGARMLWPPRDGELD